MPFPMTECTRCHKVEAWADVKHVRAILAIAAAGRDPAALRIEQLNDPSTGPILEEVKIGQYPEWKGIADRSPAYKDTGAEWKSLAVRNGITQPPGNPPTDDLK
jgi:hypothetical protein